MHKLIHFKKKLKLTFIFLGRFTKIVPVKIGITTEDPKYPKMIEEMY